MDNSRNICSHCGLFIDDFSIEQKANLIGVVLIHKAEKKELKALLNGRPRDMAYMKSEYQCQGKFKIRCPHCNHYNKYEIVFRYADIKGKKHLIDYVRRR